MTERRPFSVLPWRRRDPIDPFEGSEGEGLFVFVPAIMSVGLVFSAATVVRDVFQRSNRRSLERRATLAAATVASETLGDEPEPEDMGILARPAYLFTALLLVGGAAYVAIGSTANFLRDGGYVRDIGWLLALSLGLSVLLGFLGGVAFAVFRSWPNPPAWTLGSLRFAPLTVAPGGSTERPSWWLSASLLVAGVMTGMLTLLVGSGRSIAMSIDRPILEWLIEVEWLDHLDVVDPYGSTPVSLVFVAIIGLSAFRCRVMAALYPVAFLAAWISTAVLREVIERPRPTGPGQLESFPSGHMVQAVMLAGLVPLALGVLLADRRAVILSRVVLVTATVFSGLHRVHRLNHWPLDVIAGTLLGVTVVLGTYWLMEHRVWHLRCSGCPWAVTPGHSPWRQGLFDIDLLLARRLGVVGPALAVVAAAAFAVAAVVIGIPTDPEGYGFGSAVVAPAQLGLAALLAVAGLVAFRFRAVGAFLMVIAAGGIGLLASVEYSPSLTLWLTVGLLVPAVLTWLAWQPHETMGTIAVLALVTGGSIGTTALGATGIYDHYFGPTHPESVAESLDSAAADWLWLGGVTAEEAIVVAGGLDPGSNYAVRYWESGEQELAGEVEVEADQYGLGRFVLVDLAPATEFDYAVVPGDGADDEPDVALSGDAGFTTFDDGPQDLMVVLGSCARVGSNGAVYDTMSAEEPDLMLGLGDLHYANLESTDPADHLAMYGLTMRQPGTAALFSSVPTAYVWDDHDYGPNDADGSSVAREAVSVAYRTGVPNYGVDPDPDASIGHAFTIGRIRYVMTDTRSHRDSSTMLGTEQLDWLVEELVEASRTHGLVVWANPTPWISPDGSGSDDWSAYPEERRRIADVIAEAEIENLVMVSGDAHMVAIDDGTNSDFSSDGGGGFPLLHAAALDRPGSIKGGPYSEGAYPGSGQYGRLEIGDDGGETISVTLSGHTWEGEELARLEFDVPVGADA